MKEGDRKYSNTNDTPVFKKSRTVFALNIAKNSPQKEIILCEGNMDAVSLHAHGVSNAVASLGTALTQDQCRLLSRYANSVTVSYDSDRAGREATKKAIRLLQETGLRVKVMTLEGKRHDGEEIKDPDDYIRTFGKGAFDKAASEAKGAIEYLFAELRRGHEVDTMDGKNAFIKEAAKLLSEVPSAVEKELFIGRIAEVTSVPTEVIRQQTQAQTGKFLKQMQKENLERELKKVQGLGNRINPDKAKFLSTAAKEENILGILLLRGEYLTDAKIRPQIRPEHFKCEFCRRGIEAMLQLTEGGEPFQFSSLNEFFSPEQIGELEGLKRKREELAGNSTDILLELMARLAEEHKKQEIKSEPLTNDWLEKMKAEKQRKES
jgi:DNA primase